MRYYITKELLQAVLNYLASRPYSEVADAITALQRLQAVEEVEKKEPKK